MKVRMRYSIGGGFAPNVWYEAHFMGRRSGGFECWQHEHQPGIALAIFYTTSAWGLSIWCSIGEIR